MNLILFNVPESSDESSTVRKEHDNKMLFKWIVQSN
jgi:hypothetical protein